MASRFSSRHILSYYAIRYGVTDFYRLIDDIAAQKDQRRHDHPGLGISIRSACQGVVANEVGTVAPTVERHPSVQAFRHHFGHSLHGQLRSRS